MGLFDKQSSPVSGGSFDNFSSPIKNEPFLSKTGRFIQSAVTGVGRRKEELPALSSISDGLTDGEKLLIAGAMFTTPDEKAVGDIIKNSIPGASVSSDEFDNVIVEFAKERPGIGGKRFFVNPPGLDTTDALSVASEAVKFFPAGKLAAAAGAGKFVVPFLAEAGTSVLGDVAAGQLGSEQGISLTRAALAGGSAGLINKFSPATVRFFRRVFRTKNFFNRKTGSLTELGRRAAREAGISPDDFDATLGRDFARNLSEGASPDVAASQALGRRFGVSLTRGQASGNTDLLAREEILRNTEPAASIFRPRDRAQREAANIAAETTQRKLGGIGAQSQDIAGQIARGEIGVQQALLVSQIDDAFRVARGRNAEFTGRGLTSLLRGARRVARDFPIDDKLTPGSNKIFREFARLSRKVRSSTRTIESGAKSKPVNFSEFETVRRRINNVIDTIPRGNKADRNLAIQLKKQFDGFLDDAFDNALFSGDQAVLDAFKNARALRTALRTRFGKRNAGDEAGKIVEKILETDATPQQTVNYVFGASRLGAKGVSEKVVGRLKDTLGANSEGFRALKEIGFLKLTEGRRGFSPPAAALKIEEAQLLSPGILRELYSKDEQTLIRLFGKLMRKITTPQEVRNPSRTAFVLKNATRKALGRTQTMATFRGAPEVGFLIQIFKDIITPKGDRISRRAAIDAFRPFLTPGSGGAIASGAAAGSILTPDLEEVLENFNGR